MTCAVGFCADFLVDFVFVAVAGVFCAVAGVFFVALAFAVAGAFRADPPVSRFLGVFLAEGLGFNGGAVGAAFGGFEGAKENPKSAFLISRVPAPRWRRSRRS